MPVSSHIHQASRIGAAHTGQNGSVLYNRQHLTGHFHHDPVGVPIRHAARQRAAAVHAETPGVVDNQQINTSRFLALCADSVARSAANDWNAIRDALAQTLQNLLSCE